MRRREEGLAYWLISQDSEDRIRSSRFWHFLARSLGVFLLRPRMATLELLLEPAVRTLTEMCGAPIAVRDGLGIIGPSTKTVARPASAGDREEQRIQVKVSSVHFVRHAEVGEFAIALPEALSVTGQDWIRSPEILSKMPGLLKKPLRSLAMPLLNVLPAVRAVMWQIAPSAVGVRSAADKFSGLPHIRRSEDLQSLSQGEQDSLLREAESLKGIRRENGEILALFRCVPVEMISKINFLENKRTILYTLRSDLRARSTRVQTLAVVKDRPTASWYFVPNRTSYRVVSLD
jgi:hypothetical protein